MKSGGEIFFEIGFGAKKMKSQGWYKYTSSGESYYTNEAESKRIWFHHGDGSYMPTPAQFVELVESVGEDFVPMEEVGLVYKYDENEVLKTAVDLPPGAYVHYPSSMSGSMPERLVPISLRNDTYVKIPSIYNPLAEDLRAFMGSEEIYRKIGMLFKRGILIYGPPGEGKTSMIRAVLGNEIPNDAVTIFFEKMPTRSFVDTMNATLSSRFKVCVFEELANVLENARMERVLDFLDGESSLDRTLIIATTNYPERLPGNIVERPSRFDKIYKIGHPKAEERKLLLEHYLMRPPVDEEVKATQGLSTAAIKECCILAHLKGLTIDGAAALLKKHSALVKKEFAETRSVGFGLSADSFDSFDDETS